LLATAGPSSTLAKATAIALKRGTLFSPGQLVKLSLNSNLNLTDLNPLMRGRYAPTLYRTARVV
jgi:hypothetical protein